MLRENRRDDWHGYHQYNIIMAIGHSHIIPHSDVTSLWTWNLMVQHFVKNIHQTTTSISSKNTSYTNAHGVFPTPNMIYFILSQGEAPVNMVKRCRVPFTNIQMFEYVFMSRDNHPVIVWSIKSPLCIVAYPLCCDFAMGRSTEPWQSLCCEPTLIFEQTLGWLVNICFATHKPRFQGH